MKKLLVLLLFTNIIYAQTSRVQQDLNNFEPGELIVKLKDNVDAKVYYSKSGKATSSFNIGALLGIESKIVSSEVLFHEKSIKASIANKQRMKAVYAAKGAANPNNGYKPNEPLTMKNVFVLKTSDAQENILQLIEQIKDNPAVEYAEPNYIFSIDNFEVGDIITAEEAAKMEASSTIDVNDPLYSSQSNITSTNIDDVWDQYTTGDGSQVIAILDTGGDYTHPDLEANTWINTEELNGVEGYDDDGNGYVDDIRGWDFINIDNAPLDDNMHGTHVAGIAGAVGNNGIGIAGAAWNVKLMHIKVFQSTGQGNATTIAAGVEYASGNGATIINMSFGSFAESYTLKLALENAYTSSILVAAAGNNSKPIGPCSGCAPFFPAAYTFILGVEDAAGYSNYDQDGPIYSGYLTLLNYELIAPGTQIMSTIPGGGYAPLTGTSMSSPLVAGAMALYNEQNPEESKQLMFGNLINTSGDTYVDFLAAINAEPIPKLAVLNHILRDTINNQNGNGYWQPGETIEILPLVKNYWGPTDDVRVGIEFAEFEDTSKATIIQNEAQIGSISAYATLQDLFQTLKIQLADNIANNVDIKFVLTTWSGPNQDYMSDPVEIVINVKNSILLFGVYDEDLTLSSNYEYLVSGNLILSLDAVMTIEPGTILKISSGKTISFFDNSRLQANGNNTNFIELIAEGSSWGGFAFNSTPSTNHILNYVKIKNINGGYGIFNGVNQTARYYTITNSIITDNSFSQMHDNMGSTQYEISSSNIVGNYAQRIGQSHNLVGSNNNIINNFGGSAIYMHQYSTVNVTPLLTSTNLFNNSYGNTGGYSVICYNSGSSSPFDFYLGTSNPAYYRDEIGDIMTTASFPGLFNTSAVSNTPYEGAHGIVWKVLVNGFDARDEYASIDPVGVGIHEFKVYFNRAMDTSINPQVSYGVTIPYNQKIISEEGTWSTDGKIYTVTHEINIGAADGINRIRVQDAQDLDYFKIPVEDSRFNMLVQSAGSASTGWFSTAGLGKIDLEWTAPSAGAIDDALGYNMYRYIANADGTFTDPVKLNESLIVEDTDDATTGVYYTDYNVAEGQTYFYKYNILRTSFETTDYSSVVSTAPLTSTLGDSNGDFTVNVMDLVQDVDYILGNNPSPFIFVAGDVNNDQAINVLDIVGTVDIILNPTSGKTVTNGPNSITYYSNTAVGDAIFNWEGNDLFVTSNYDVGGIQLAFNQDFEYMLSDNLPGVERLNYTQDDAAVLMLYSFNNTVIANAKTKILTRTNASQQVDINQAVVGTTSGRKLNAVLNNGTLGTIDAPFQSNQLELLKLYPNPSDGIVTLRYYLPELMDGVAVKIYDIQGRLVWKKDLDNVVGKTEKQLQLNKLKAGNYIVLMSAYKHGGVKYLSHKILIIQ
jgi:subtilisin family serine protease